jgi:hypothetical protein
MPLVLTILSVLAFWAFLTVLVIGLLLIHKALEAIRRNLERITMGVRAIEVQTAPLGGGALQTVAVLRDIVADLPPLLEALTDNERNLSHAAPVLKRRLRG